MRFEIVFLGLKKVFGKRGCRIARSRKHESCCSTDHNRKGAHALFKKRLKVRLVQNKNLQENASRLIPRSLRLENKDDSGDMAARKTRSVEYT